MKSYNILALALLAGTCFVALIVEAQIPDVEILNKAFRKQVEEDARNHAEAMKFTELSFKLNMDGSTSGKLSSQEEKDIVKAMNELVDKLSEKDKSSKLVSVGSGYVRGECRDDNVRRIIVVSNLFESAQVDGCKTCVKRLADNILKKSQLAKQAEWIFEECRLKYALTPI